MRCDSCEGEIPETAKVCGYCGQRRLVACAGCGQPVGVTAQACGNCRRPLDPLAEASGGDSAVPVDEVEPESTPEATPAREPEIAPVVAEAGGRRRGVLISLALVVLVAAGAIAGWFLLTDDDGGSSTPAPESEVVPAAHDWAGAWESTDLDGSSQWLSLAPSDDFPQYDAVGVYYDDRSSSGPCPGDAVVANLIATETTNTEIVVEGTLWCPSFAETPSTPMVLAGDHCPDREAGCVLRQTGTTRQWEITSTEFEWALTWEETSAGGELSGPTGNVDEDSWVRSDNPNLIEIRFEGTKE